MSGFNLTLIIRDKKVSKDSNFFSDLNFDKEKKTNSFLNCEFSINKQVSIENQVVLIYDDFHIDYDGKIKNNGYSELFWKEVLDQINNPQCSIDINTMSRDYGSLYVILEHLKQLLLENYCFYIITNNITYEIQEKFNLSSELLMLNGGMYLISEKIIDYIIKNKILNFVGY